MRSMMLALVLLFPAIVAAQDGGIRLSADRLVADAVAAPAGPIAVDALAGQPGQRTPPPPPPPSDGRRRPSMVGYIGDGSIGSQVRIRFDAGFEMTAADRAEVFYGKCGCYRGLPSGHPAFDPAAPGPGPGIADEVRYQQLYVLGEYAFNGRTSVYGEVPFRWLQPQSFVAGTGTFDNSSGLSDIKGGIKVALASSADHFLTVQVQADAPSGDAAKGLGTDHWTVSPTLLYLQRIGERVAIESQFGSLLPIGGSAGIPTSGSEKFAGRVLMYGVGASVEMMSRGDVSFAPVVEVVGWRVQNGFQTSTLGPADGINIVNLKVGARLGVGNQGSFYVGYGRALTDNTWYHDIVRAEYRYGF